MSDVSRFAGSLLCFLLFVLGIDIKLHPLVHPLTGSSFTITSGRAPRPVFEVIGVGARNLGDVPI